MEYLQYASIVIEFLIALIGFAIFLQKKKIYGLAILFTFATYVLYDLAKLLSLNISDNFLSVIFFLATISAFFAVFMIFKEKRKGR
jgi:hypothetical protein